MADLGWATAVLVAVVFLIVWWALREDDVHERNLHEGNVDWRRTRDTWEQVWKDAEKARKRVEGEPPV